MAGPSFLFFGAYVLALTVLLCPDHLSLYHRWHGQYAEADQVSVMTLRRTVDLKDYCFCLYQMTIRKRRRRPLTLHARLIQGTHSIRSSALPACGRSPSVRRQASSSADNDGPESTPTADSPFARASDIVGAEPAREVDAIGRVRSSRTRMLPFLNISGSLL